MAADHLQLDDEHQQEYTGEDEQSIEVSEQLRSIRRQMK